MIFFTYPCFKALTAITTAKYVFQFLQALSQRQYHSSSLHEYIVFAPLFLHEWIYLLQS